MLSKLHLQFRQVTALVAVRIEISMTTKDGYLPGVTALVAVRIEILAIIFYKERSDVTALVAVRIEIQSLRRLTGRFSRHRPFGGVD